MESIAGSNDHLLIQSTTNDFRIQLFIFIIIAFNKESLYIT